jgi:hypothetical protein
MDIDNPIVRLCGEGARAEFEGRRADARDLYARAWEAAQDDYEACIAAHYVARFQECAEETLRWNQIALERAYLVTDGRAADFFPSLYLNLGRSYELTGNPDEAGRFYALAAALGVEHHEE